MTVHNGTGSGQVQLSMSVVTTVRTPQVIDFEAVAVIQAESERWGNLDPGITGNTSFEIAPSVNNVRLRTFIETTGGGSIDFNAPAQVVLIVPVAVDPIEIVFGLEAVLETEALPPAVGPSGAEGGLSDRGGDTRSRSGSLSPVKESASYQTNVEAPSENWYGQVVAVDAMFPGVGALGSSSYWVAPHPLLFFGVVVSGSIEGEVTVVVIVDGEIIHEATHFGSGDPEESVVDPDGEIEIAAGALVSVEVLEMTGAVEGLSVKMKFLSPVSYAGSVVFLPDGWAG